MENRTFAVGEAVSFGWNTTKKNIGFLAGIMFALWILSLISQAVSRAVMDNAVLLVMVGILSFVIDAILTMGVIKIALKLHDNQKPPFSDIISCYPMILKYIGAIVIFWVLAAVGMLLLIVPGIIVMLRLQFFGYFIVDKNKGPVEALKASWEATKGNGLNLLVLWMAFLGITILGILALLVGLLAAIPVAILAMTFVYRKLSPA